MKKSVQYTGVCLALISAFLTFAACGDEPINVTMQQIYNANTTAALLQEYNKIGTVTTDRNEEKTETYLDGAIYYEAVSSGGAIVRECYDKAGTVGYQKDVDGTYYSLFLQAEALKAKPTQAYISQIFDDETLALQEEIVSATRKGDNIQVKTKLSESHSATVFTLDGYVYQSGEYLETEYTLDKDTYHVLTAKRITKNAEGATKLYKTVEQKTRISPDGEIATLNARVQAVLGKTNLRQITISIDPNTINEGLCSAYAVMGDKFKIELGKNYPQLYTDVSCTQPYEFTDGDERKLFMKLYTKEVFIPVEYDFTMQDIIDANANVQTWLQGGNSITVKTNVIGVQESLLYFDDVKLYTHLYSVAWGYDVVCESIYYADGSLGYSKQGENCVATLKNDLSSAYENVILDAATVKKEVIQYAEVNGEKLKLTTKLSAEDLQAIQDTSYAEGDSLLTEYVLDARTYLVEKYEIYVLHQDGTKYLQSKKEVVFGEDMPAGAQALYARMTATENVRQVVVVANPGTMNIAVYRLNVVQGDTFYMAGYKLYTDAECTQEFEDVAPYDTDCLLYAKPISE